MQPLDTSLIIYLMGGNLHFTLILNLVYRKKVSNYHQVNLSMWNNLRRLKYAHWRAKQLASKQEKRLEGLYDQECRGAELKVGVLVLVRQTAKKGRQKVQDRWEDEECKVIGQPTSGIPAYEVQHLNGKKSRICHRSLLLPLEGKCRQEGGL